MERTSKEEERRTKVLNEFSLLKTPTVVKSAMNKDQQQQMQKQMDAMKYFTIPYLFYILGTVILIEGIIMYGIFNRLLSISLSNIGFITSIANVSMIMIIIIYQIYIIKRTR